MAKGNRFPSDVNPSKQAKKVEVQPVKSVEGQHQNLVKILYTKKNHHLLDHVYALAPGENQVPLRIWDSAKDHPTVKEMLKSGHIVDVTNCVTSESAPSDDPAQAVE